MSLLRAPDEEASSARSRLLLLVMLAILAAYVAVHSPARDGLATLLHTQAHGCYFCLTAAAWAETVSALATALFLVLAATAAVILAGTIQARPDERILAFGLSFLALVSVPAALVGVLGYWLGLPLLRPPLGPVLSLLPALTIVGMALATGWRPRPVRLHLPRLPGLVVWVGGLAATLQVATVIVSLRHPATSGDALSYHAPLAVFLWQEGNLGTFLERGPDIWALAHPGVAEVWFGALRVIGGEGLADLGQWPFAWLGAAAAAVFARRLGLAHGSAMLAAAAYLLVPIVVLQVGGQANDVVGSAVLMASVALASSPSWTHRRAAFVGIGLGLTATTKLALLPIVPAVGLYLLIRQRNLRLLLVLAALYLVVVSPWWARNAARYGNPVYPAAIPVLGRGVFIGDLGPADTSFVPSALAWPLYPTMEAHDDRSGFGALVIVGLIPGLAMLAVRRRSRRVLALYGLGWAFMLTAWWIVTLHEPRFLLGLVGLGFGALPWTLQGARRGLQRRIVALVLAAAAAYSALVTFDQGLLPLIVQPADRTTFYDRVWAVDPAASTLPESEGVLLHTGFAPLVVPEYAAYYPLLGPDQGRLVVPVDGPKSGTELAARMRSASIRYAYVLAAPDNRAQVEAMYDSALFEQISTSTIVVGEPSGTRRHLFRSADESEAGSATTRYLFELR